MQLSKMAQARWMLCSLSLLAGCAQTERIAVAVKPPAERLQCAPAGDRPSVPPEYAVDWTRALTAPSVSAAMEAVRLEHMRYVASVRAREGVVTGYVLKVEGQLFVCSNNAAWLRDFYAGLPDAKAAGN